MQNGPFPVAATITEIVKPAPPQGRVARSVHAVSVFTLCMPLIIMLIALFRDAVGQFLNQFLLRCKIGCPTALQCGRQKRESSVYPIYAGFSVIYKVRNTGYFNGDFQKVQCSA